eukprot:6158396-Prymnesium_polylepis.1
MVTREKKEVECLTVYCLISLIVPPIPSSSKTCIHTASQSFKPVRSHGGGRCCVVVAWPSPRPG